MEPFIGQVILFAGNFAPRGWAFCDGQLLSISEHQALFSILGTTYGGDGRTTFALPDLRGRAPLHQGSGPGLSHRRLGEKGGSEENTLTVQQMPAHNHTVTGTVRVTDEDASNTEAEGHALSGMATVDIYDEGGFEKELRSGSVTGTTSHAGANHSVNNMQPWLGMNFIIALQGLYPSRS